jgi:predicted nucleotidyltransferase
MGKEKDKVKELIEKLRKFKRDRKIEKLILFGSFARGEYKPESDVDLIVVDKRFVGIDRFKRGKGFWISWHKKHRIPYPVDFLFILQKNLKN